MFLYQPKAIGGFIDEPHGSNRPIADSASSGPIYLKPTLQ
jgi:hypothetical protein